MFHITGKMEPLAVNDRVSITGGLYAWMNATVLCVETNRCQVKVDNGYIIYKDRRLLRKIKPICK